MDEKDKIRERYKLKDDEVQIIEADPILDIFEFKEKLRVCAYCRVSTDNIEQTSSYELQKAKYEEYIKKYPNWELVDIYADEGISGTDKEHRDGFNRMISDCELGKIDLILTKSVSRFARNLVDLVSTIRHLKSLKNPVRILFESDNIDSFDQTHYMMLQFAAMMAESESKNKSDIMTWSIRERYNRGNFNVNDLFGFRIDENKNFIIQEDEAEIIILVYSLYVTGHGPSEIVDIMTRLGFKSNMKGECKWSTGVVDNIIRNERRCGLLYGWKTFTPDFLTHKTKKNRGERNRYIRENHHQGIIPQEMFEYAIEIKRLSKLARFKGEIPSLSVITTGALKGFVPVCRNYPGFSYSNYLFASNYAYDRSGKGIRKENELLLSKEQISQFDFSGFEKVDSNLFQTNERPTCWFKYNQMFFNVSCLNKMKRTEYVELLFEPLEGLLAIRSCDKHYPNAIKWTAEKDGRLYTSVRSCSGFANILFESLGWNPNYKYRIVGTKRENRNDAIVIFSLFDAEPYKVEKVQIDEETEMLAFNLFNKYYIDHFGKPFYDDAYANRLYLMDVFKHWNLGAEVVYLDEKDWMKKAKETVNKYIKQLEEGNA